MSRGEEQRSSIKTNKTPRSELPITNKQKPALLVFQVSHETCAYSTRAEILKLSEFLG